MGHIGEVVVGCYIIVQAQNRFKYTLAIIYRWVIQSFRETLYNILLYTYTLLYFKATVFNAQGACKNKIKFICQQLLSAVNYKTKLRSVKNWP